MPVKARDLQQVACQLGFENVRQKGSHARWIHSDGRATTIPVHGNREIGGWLFHEILNQMGIDAKEFEKIMRDL